MNEVYKVSGMTCDGCANSIKEALEINKYISYVNISLEDENINISSDKSFTVNELNSLIDNLGNYKIYEEKFTSKLLNIFLQKDFVIGIITCFNILSVIAGF